MESFVESYEKEFWAEKYPPKVKAMFEAVLELFASGKGLNSLTVSEITAKAGIGKGTAYEYFSTKEEMIAGALEYEGKKHIRIIYELIESERSFREIIMTGFGLMDGVFGKYRGFAVIIKILHEDTVNGGDMLTEMKKHEACFGVVKGLVEKVAELARKEHLIQETDYYKIQTAIISQVMGYAAYIVYQEIYSGVDSEKAKEVAYENILKLLN